MDGSNGKSVALLECIVERLESMDARIESMDARIESMDARIDGYAGWKAACSVSRANSELIPGRDLRVW